MVSTTPILSVNEVGANQNNKTVTINDAFIALEQATNQKASKAISGTTAWTLTQTECQRNVYYETTGSSGAFNVIFKEKPDATNSAQRLFAFHNATANTATVKSDNTGTTVAVKAGYTALIRQSGVDMILVALDDGSLTVPRDVPVLFLGTPGDSVLIARYVATRALTVPLNLAGIQGKVTTAPGADVTLTVKKSGSSIGTITIAGTSGAISASVTLSTLAAGDYLDIFNQASHDASLVDVALTLALTRAK